MPYRKLQVPEHIIKEAQEEIGSPVKLGPVDPQTGIQLKSPKRNSEISLAHQLVECMQKTRPTVSTQSLVWQYDDTLGIWEPIDKDSVLGIIDRFDGIACGKKTIYLSDTKAKGIYNAALRHREIYEPNFFEEAPVGVQTKTGFLGLQEGAVSLLPTSADNRTRFALPLEYCRHAPQKRWRDFLEGLFPHDQDRAEKISVLQEFLGLSLIGQASQFAKVLVLTGGGANGKSTFIEHISRLFPKDGLKSIIPQKWKEEYYLAQLRDSLLNTCNEMPTTEIMGSDTFKAVVTGEQITARLPYTKPFQFSPGGGHVFACNALPYVTDHTKGFWRRFLVIDFTADFSRGKVETKQGVLDRLEKDLPATLAWAIQGANLQPAHGWTRIYKKKAPKGHDFSRESVRKD